MRWSRGVGIGLAALVFCGAAGAGAAGRSTLRVEAGGETHVFRVETAVTPSERERGLMLRTELPEDGGMLFLYPEPTRPTVWMKNTFLPLDILFLSADGTVVQVVADMMPLSTRLVAPDLPVRGFLEVNAGTAARLGLAPGARLIHPFFEALR